MRQSVSRRVALGLGALLLAGTVAMAQQARQYEPREGQPGKDVIWLPTHSNLVYKMLDMANVKSTDIVIDLGSGDGRTVITAAQRGAEALGIEYNPQMVEFAAKRAAQAGVEDRARFVKADIFESDFSKATVITMFLLPDLNMRLKPKLLALKPGTRIVSNSFRMGEWEPDQTTEAGVGCTEHCDAYLWIVPANFGGVWKLPDGMLRLEQKFQMVTGTIQRGNVTVPIRDGKVNGARLTFSASGKDYALELGPNGLTGTESVKSSIKAIR
jgi:SAM-dependent methyltransferase